MQMHSKNKRARSPEENAYVEAVKALPCVVCCAPAPSDAHEPEQGLWFISIPLCHACHKAPHGWHGDRSRWRAAKLTELQAINETHRRLAFAQAGQPIPETVQRVRKRGGNLSSSKIVQRRAA